MRPRNLFYFTSYISLWNYGDVYIYSKVRLFVYSFRSLSALIALEDFLFTYEFWICLQIYALGFVWASSCTNNAESWTATTTSANNWGKTSLHIWLALWSVLQSWLATLGLFFFGNPGHWGSDVKVSRLSTGSTKGQVFMNDLKFPATNQSMHCAYPHRNNKHISFQRSIAVHIIFQRFYRWTFTLQAHIVSWPPVPHHSIASCQVTGFHM